MSKENQLIQLRSKLEEIKRKISKYDAGKIGENTSGISLKEVNELQKIKW